MVWSCGNFLGGIGGWGMGWMMLFWIVLIIALTLVIFYFLKGGQFNGRCCGGHRSNGKGDDNEELNKHRQGHSKLRVKK